MDNKRILALSFLIIALAIGYYLVIYIPQKNQELLDLQKQQLQQQAALQKQKQQQATANRKALTICLDQARASYNVAWRADCRDEGLLPSGCNEASIKLSFEDYQKQNHLSGTQGFAAYAKYINQKMSLCTCNLPVVLSNAANNDLQQSRNTCFKEYPQD